MERDKIVQPEVLGKQLLATLFPQNASSLGDTLAEPLDREQHLK
jgi:hypothetical protein